MKRNALWILACILLLSFWMTSCLSDDDDEAADDDDDVTDDDDDNVTDDDDDVTDDDDDNVTDDDDDVTDDDDDNVTDDDDDDASPYDPLPEAKEPGEYECENCPDMDLSMTAEDFTIAAGAVTTYVMSSDAFAPVQGALKDGDWYLVQKDVDEPKENWGVIPTDESGAFEVTLPLFCGKQLFKMAWANEDGTYGVVLAMETTDCLDEDIRATLSWGAGANDLELHLIREGGQLNVAPDDCTWTNMNPDWGVADDATDNPQKDVDHTSDNGLENIRLAKPENIKYRVMVEYWGSGDPIDATLVLMLDGQIQTKTLGNFTTQKVWDAAVLDWTNRSITWLTSDPIDCSASWASGCTATLPEWE